MPFFIQKKLKNDNVDGYICGKVIGNDEIEVVKVVQKSFKLSMSST